MNIVEELYQLTLGKMVAEFETLESHLAKPEQVKFNDGYVYRFAEQSIQAALLQKLARVITGLQAIQVLNQAGLIQEQSALQRISDELTEDISFLSHAIIFNDHTDLHDRYLAAFYEEEYEDGKTAIEARQKRPMISRDKIRAYINKNRGQKIDQSTGIEANRTLSKSYSGYVHSASPQVMELYYGNPPQFNLHGAYQSPLYEDHVEDLLNYFYRGILAFAFAAKL